MYSYEFKSGIKEAKLENLLTGCFICIWHANKIPPHIGIIKNGSYFSLKVKGKDSKIPVIDIIKVIRSKNICSVFVEVLSEIQIEQIDLIFTRYSKAETNKNTCLTPISEIFGFKEKVHKLADLLNSFERNNQIGQLFGLNLNPDFKGIPQYGKEEIEERLRQLSKVLD